jgi:hypothetical protein
MARHEDRDVLCLRECHNTLDDSEVADAEGWNIYEAGGDLKAICKSSATTQTTRRTRMLRSGS